MSYIELVTTNIDYVVESLQRDHETITSNIELDVQS